MLDDSHFVHDTLVCPVMPITTQCSFRRRRLLCSRYPLNLRTPDIGATSVSCPRYPLSQRPVAGFVASSAASPANLPSGFLEAPPRALPMPAFRSLTSYSPARVPKVSSAPFTLPTLPTEATQSLQERAGIPAGLSLGSCPCLAAAHSSSYFLPWSPMPSPRSRASAKAVCRRGRCSRRAGQWRGQGREQPAKGLHVSILGRQRGESTNVGGRGRHDCCLGVLRFGGSISEDGYGNV